MAGLQVTATIPVTDAVLVASSIPENDYPAWSAGQTYAMGVRVIADHSVWESFADNNRGNPPASSPLQWGLVGATNRWRPFDLSISSAAQFDTAAFYEFRPFRPINTVAILGFSGLWTVRVQLIDDDAGVIYDQTVDAVAQLSSPDWWTWTFEARTDLNQVVLRGLPNYPFAKLRVDFTGATGARVGAIAFGAESMIGFGITRARISAESFSRKERNQNTGETYLLQRASAKLATFGILLQNDTLDATFDLLAELDAVPCLWIGADQWRTTVLWGFYRAFDIDVQYTNTSEATLDLEGLI